MPALLFFVANGLSAVNGPPHIVVTVSVKRAMTILGCVG